MTIAHTSMADRCRIVGVMIDRKVAMTPKIEITHTKIQGIARWEDNK